MMTIRELTYWIPLYTFLLTSLFALLFGYYHNEKMIEVEEYEYMVDPWKPILLNWAIVTIFILGVCLGT